MLTAVPVQALSSVDKAIDIFTGYGLFLAPPGELILQEWCKKISIEVRLRYMQILVVCTFIFIKHILLHSVFSYSAKPCFMFLSPILFQHEYKSCVLAVSRHKESGPDPSLVIEIRHHFSATTSFLVFFQIIALSATCLFSSTEYYSISKSTSSTICLHSIGTPDELWFKRPHITSLISIFRATNLGKMAQKNPFPGPHFRYRRFVDP